MKLKKLGNGPEITEIGIGTWAIGGPWSHGWGPQNDADSVAAIETALDKGVNWIDTAAVYGLGHSEEIVARAVGKKRDKVIIATKCGLPWNDKGKIKMNIQPESIRRECEASLKRLNTDYIDLYQIHWPDNKTPVEEAWREMVNLQKEGKVKYIGVSNFDDEMLEKCRAIAPVTSLQPPYNILRREIEEKILPWCSKHNTGVVAYSPMMSGLLSGSFDKGRVENLAKDDWRRYNKFFKEPLFTHVLNLVNELEAIAKKYSTTVGALAVAWVLANSAVTSAIMGVRNRDQALQIDAGAGVKLAPDDLVKINELGLI